MMKRRTHGLVLAATLAASACKNTDVVEPVDAAVTQDRTPVDAPIGTPEPGSEAATPGPEPVLDAALRDDGVEPTVDAATGAEAGPETGPEDAPADRADTSVAPDVAGDATQDAIADGGMDAAADAGPEAGVDASPDVAMDVQPARTWCSLGTDVAHASVPAAFCLRRFADASHARWLAMAPNGDLFVSAPSTGDGAGRTGNLGTILVLSDDDRDGTAEYSRYLSSATLPGGTETLASVHGLVVGAGFVWFTTPNAVWRVPYTTGQRTATAVPERVGTFTSLSGQRWTHGLALSITGAVYATQATYTSNACSTAPMAGNVTQLALDSGNTLLPRMNGFRNPMYARCHPTDALCLVAELGEDQATGAVEKFVTIENGANHGYPCCYRQNVRGALGGSYDCSTTPPEVAYFPIADTPFGFDWERGNWPAPYRNAIFVARHGSFYTTPQFNRAGIVYGATDPVTHLPSGNAWQPFVEGFLPTGGAVMGRPADVVFGPDGRMFFADDHHGGIYWVAARTQTIP